MVSCETDDKYNNVEDDLLVVFSEDSIPHLPDSLFNYSNYVLPQQFSEGGLSFFEFIPFDNPITDEGATLGRVLFYDKKLSINNSISCASCHKQELGFADDKSFSIGFNGEHTMRNSMPLANLQFSRRMFWDFRAQTLEEQVLMPIEDSIEMGLPHEHLIEKLQEIDYYKPLFTHAFGDETITLDRISKALSQFVRSIVSYNTKYDVGLATNFENFTEIELLGKNLFLNGEKRCNNCHLTANFYSVMPLNNGLDVDYDDEGAGNGRFKAPSLRNIALTAPYMHDGRFNTLEAVIEHYNSGLQPHPFLGDQLTENFVEGDPPIDLQLSDLEKQALIAFLNTLTDSIMVTDEKYSNPFMIN